MPAGPTVLIAPFHGLQLSNYASMEWSLGHDGRVISDASPVQPEMLLNVVTWHPSPIMIRTDTVEWAGID